MALCMAVMRPSAGKLRSGRSQVRVKAQGDLLQLLHQLAGQPCLGSGHTERQPCYCRQYDMRHSACSCAMAYRAALMISYKLRPISRAASCKLSASLTVNGLRAAGLKQLRVSGFGNKPAPRQRPRSTAAAPARGRPGSSAGPPPPGPLGAHSLHRGHSAFLSTLKHCQHISQAACPDTGL